MNLAHEALVRRATLLALTGFGRPEDRRRGFEAGFDEHLLKPPGPQELSAVLARVASGAPAR